MLAATEKIMCPNRGIRISYPEPGGKPKVIDGPFTEAKEMIAGYTLIEVKSREEAVEWALRMPDPHGYGQGEIELRQVFEFEELTDDTESQEKEAILRKQAQEQKKA